MFISWNTQAPYEYMASNKAKAKSNNGIFYYQNTHTHTMVQS